ncbi:RND family efflux transporter MFP subunit [Halospina denitrificans]|uniref:RND family efflux transporter MFP subunit n=1 Tax=Halospina denitrificans TaxID=332522 RepID=A0A4R7JVK8_9GAMM|nr:efflux RND transporter periplasmic adaptor subunit [Halospina denitrificans]TDT41463.1 RND family efflux transporter MFP subunit [Halospina denitrificans]
MIEQGARRWAWPLALVLAAVMIAPRTGASEGPKVRTSAVNTAEIIRETVVNGTVTALRRSSLSAAVSGQIEVVQVEAGDRVEEGDLLVRLDDELESLSLESARASTREARAALEDAERRVREARSVGEGRNIAATEVSTRESEKAQAEARLARLEADEKRQQARVTRHRITAPFSGVISMRSSDPGEWVDPGDTLLTLVDTDNLYLDFQVPQSYFGRESEAELILTSSGDNRRIPIHSRVGVVDPQLRTFMLRARPDEPGDLSPGMTVTGKLRFPTGREGIGVPRDALNRYPEGRVTVWVLGEASDQGYAIREERVSVAARYEDNVIVTEGLSAGERVIVRGNESLEPGMTVRLAEPEAD